MRGNSRNGKSGNGTGSGTGSETDVEELVWIGTFLRMFMLPVCCCIAGGRYSFRSPLSSKKSAPGWDAAAA